MRNLREREKTRKIPRSWLIGSGVTLGFVLMIVFRDIQVVWGLFILALVGGIFYVVHTLQQRARQPNDYVDLLSDIEQQVCDFIETGSKYLCKSVLNESYLEVLKEIHLLRAQARMAIVKSSNENKTHQMLQAIRKIEAFDPRKLSDQNLESHAQVIAQYKSVLSDIRQDIDAERIVLQERGQETDTEDKGLKEAIPLHELTPEEAEQRERERASEEQTARQAEDLVEPYRQRRKLLEKMTAEYDKEIKLVRESKAILPESKDQMIRELEERKKRYQAQILESYKQGEDGE